MDDKDMSLITTIFSSTVVAGLVSFVLTMFKEERSIKREKLEDLYIHVSEWTRILNLFGLPYGFAMQGKLTLKEARESVPKLSDTGNNFDKMNMLVGIYFPRLQKDLDALIL